MNADPFSDDPYSEKERQDYCAWPEAAQDILDRSWSMSLGTYDLLARAFKLTDEQGKRLCMLGQNMLIGRVDDLRLLPELIARATGSDIETSRAIAASIATTTLIPFNALTQRWDLDVRKLYDDWT